MQAAPSPCDPVVLWAKILITCVICASESTPPSRAVGPPTCVLQAVTIPRPSSFFRVDDATGLFLRNEPPVK